MCEIFQGTDFILDTKKKKPQKTHAEENLDKIGVIFGDIAKTFPRKLFLPVQQIGVFCILITDFNKTAYERTGKVKMYEMCKETTDYSKNLMIMMSGLKGLDTCFTVDQCGWLMEGFVIE